MSKTVRILLKILFSILALGLFVLSAFSIPGFDSLLFLFAAALLVPIDDWWEKQEEWFHGKLARILIIVAMVGVGLVLSALEVPNSEKQYDLEEFIQQEMENDPTAADTVISGQVVE